MVLSVPSSSSFLKSHQSQSGMVVVGSPWGPPSSSEVVVAGESSRVVPQTRRQVYPTLITDNYRLKKKNRLKILFHLFKWSVDDSLNINLNTLIALDFFLFL